MRPPDKAVHTIDVVVDGAWLLPPHLAGISSDEWILLVGAWADVLADAPARTTCPRSLHDAALEAWWSERDGVVDALKREGSPLTHQDLLQVLEQLSGRLVNEALPPNEEVVFTRVATEPEYSHPRLGHQSGDIEHHLAAVALCRRDRARPSSVITSSVSWNRSCDTIAVEAEIGLLISQAIESEPSGDAALIRELLAGVTTISALYGFLNKHPCALCMYPRLAVVAAYVAELGGEARELAFEVGDAFCASLRCMNYERQPGRAATCWRTMAFVAAGRESELQSLQAHPHRQGTGAGARPVSDDVGRVLMRGYLAQKSPNAHRVFWWSGASPEFVGIGGHDSGPPVQAK